MKKIIAIAVLGTITMVSCSKDYQCTVTTNGVSVSTDYLGLDSDEAALQETACNNAAIGDITTSWTVK